MKRLHALAAALVVLGLAAGVQGALTITDAAPPIIVSKWVKGEPVKALEKGKIYVVEFWATWCGPCKATIPHLTELAHKYKEVTFIGTSVWENDDKLVEPFVKEMGDKMDYRIAMDEKKTITKGAMAVNWMDAAAQNGIPTAFVVGKDSTIQWIGHPMELEPVLAKVVAGSWDPLPAKEALEKEQKIAQAMMDLRKEYAAQVEPLVQKNDYAAALKAMDGMIEKHPDMKRWLLHTEFALAVKGKQWDAAYAAADQIVPMKGEDAAGSLNDIAWAIATDAAITRKDLDRALTYAQRAVELTNKESATLIDTLARVYAEKGDMGRAVEMEELALGKASAAEKPEFAKALAEYKAKLK